MGVCRLRDEGARVNRGVWEVEAWRSGGVDWWCGVAVIGGAVGVVISLVVVVVVVAIGNTDC